MWNLSLGKSVNGKFCLLQLLDAFHGEIDPALQAQLNKNKNKTTIDSEYQKLQKQNLDEWVNIRGPRPWEDSRAHQEEQRKNLNAGNT
ncbi:cytochrome c oxidase assembly protein COX16 homolog, mitochondrial isoform X3 [Scyliorhinus canicula]|uniref:cytochrome c oxidase assembly protein COX16 homolog, mitochondrial isoform X3 n=1 Tax=Scyliorhinus canicula TaxID=7830 RepID=UPI0018F7216C|nr:cytochrome c oxidase assembly protein COX16 homolog, mitochondrial isoform X3 [Scyliorhinus canicula]